MPRRGFVIVASALADRQVDPTLRRFFKAVGVKHGRQSTYAAALHAIGDRLGRGEPATSLAHLFAAVDIGNSDAAYGAFTETRAKRARHDTVLERREVLQWLKRFGPRFAVVEVAQPHRRGAVLTAALGARPGLIPLAAHRDEKNPDVVGALWEEMGQAQLRLPIVTTDLAGATLETVLEASSRLSFDHFARVDHFWPVSPRSRLKLDWSNKHADEPRHFADAVQAFGSPVKGHEQGRAAMLRVNRKTLYLAFGPSATGDYYLQRQVAGDRSRTMRALLARMRALEGVDLGLGAWPVAALAMRASAGASYARTVHAIVMASAYSLFREIVGTAESTTGASETPRVAALDPPAAWRAVHEAWTRIARELDQGIL